MELVEGPTLADLLAHGPIPVNEALPANIKVREDGTVPFVEDEHRYSSATG